MNKQVIKLFTLLLISTKKSFFFLSCLLVLQNVSFGQCVVGTAIPTAPATCNPAGSTAITSTTSASPTTINTATTYYSTGAGIKYGALDISSGPLVINVCSGSTLDLIIYSLNTSNVTINVLAGGTLRTSAIEKYTLNVYGNLIASGDLYIQNSPTINVASSGIFQVFPYHFNATSTAGKFYNEGTVEVGNFYLNTVPNPYICMNNSGCIRVRGLLTNNDNTSNPIQAGATGGFFSLDQTAGSTTNNQLTNDADMSVCLKTAQTNFCKGPATPPCSGANNLFTGSSVNPASCTNGSSSKCSNPLPIILNSFVLNETQEGVLLAWMAYSTDETAYYLVEVSNDGSSWNSLGTVDGSNAAHQLTEFSYLHRMPRNGRKYYKVTEILTSEGRGLSVIGLIQKNMAVSFSIFPNPANDHISVYLNEILSAKMEIYDVPGHLLYSGWILEGKNEIETSGFANGLYFVKIHSGLDVNTKKLYVIR